MQHVARHVMISAVVSGVPPHLFHRRGTISSASPDMPRCLFWLQMIHRIPLGRREFVSS